MRLPSRGEVIGTITEALGSCHFRADCEDGKTRLVRIPGRLKRRKINIRAGYVVLLEPWSVEPDEKADLIWSYSPADVSQLKQRGLL